MFVLTMDRRRSRASTRDDIADTLESLGARWGSALAIPAARFAGDELQLVTADPAVCVSIALDSTRDAEWSVGIGVGSATLNEAPGAATGDAFFAARRAVDRAKRSPVHVAVESERDTNLPNASDTEAVLSVIIALRARRSVQGWEVADLLESAKSQRAVASSLGISASAVSERALTAGIRVESAARTTVTSMFHALDQAVSRHG